MHDVHRLGISHCETLTSGECIIVELTELGGFDEGFGDCLLTGPVSESTVQSIVATVERRNPESGGLLHR